MATLAQQCVGRLSRILKQDPSNSANLSRQCRTFPVSEGMDDNLRRRFTNPFPVQRTTAGSKFNPSTSRWEQEQSTIPPHAPRLLAEPQASRSDGTRVHEKDFKQISESKTERRPRQKVCRSLFGTKSTSSEEQSHLDKDQFCNRGSLLSSEWLENGDKGTHKHTSISFVELPVPEMLQDANLMDSTSCHIGLEELRGSVDEVSIHYPFDFCELLKPGAVEKFKVAISPTKVCAPHFPQFPSPSTTSIIDDEDSCTEVTRVPKNKEKPVQVASLSASLFSKSSTGKKRMIRGYSIPRCGRLTNQSYQEQAKEFQEILSSKVRQVAEVADCLQHKELLYKILQL